jgi:hypothetical protein
MVASDGVASERPLDILMLSCEFPPIGGGGSLGPWVVKSVSLRWSGCVV